MRKTGLNWPWQARDLWTLALFLALIFHGRKDRNGTLGTQERHSWFWIKYPKKSYHQISSSLVGPRKCFFSRHHKWQQLYVHIFAEIYMFKKTNKNLPIMFQQAFECIIFIWNMILENDHTQCNIMRAAFIYCWTEIHHNIKMLSYMSWLEITEQNLTHASVLSKPQHALCS